LDFNENKQGACCFTLFSKELQKGIRGNTYATHPLNPLDDDSGNVRSNGFRKGGSSLKGRKMILCPALKGPTIFGLSVAATAPDVLPWNDFLRQ